MRTLLLAEAARRANTTNASDEEESSEEEEGEEDEEEEEEAGGDDATPEIPRVIHVPVRQSLAQELESEQRPTKRLRRSRRLMNLPAEAN